MRHPRQFHVADIGPAPLHQPVEVWPRHGLADIGIRPIENRERARVWPASSSCRPSPARARRGLHGVDNGLIAGTAAIIAGKMLAYLLAVRLWRCCCSKSCAAISMPGVQYPHCSALRSRKAACRSAISPLSDRPSMVSTDVPCVCTASIRQARTISSFTRTVQAPQTPCSQPTCVPVRCRCSRRKSARLSRGKTCASTRSPLTSSETGYGSRHAALPLQRSGRPSSVDMQRANNTFARCRRMEAVAC